jgi:hypothetical protein
MTGVEAVSNGVQAFREPANRFAKMTLTMVRPSLKGGVTRPELVVIQSPYRFVITPIVEYVFELEERLPDRQIAIVIPNLVERRWYRRFLHNQRGELLSALLLLNGSYRTAIINVPWYLRN